MQNVVQREPVPLRALLAYGSIAAPLAILIVPLYNYLPAFYASELGLDLTAIGVIFFTTRLWDAILDPLIGTWCDGTQLRSHGRRKPWIVIAAPALVLFGYLICMPPENAGYGYLSAVLLVFYVAWTCVQIPHLAWGADLANSYLDRNRVVTVRESFFMLGILTAVSLPVLVLGTSDLDLRAIMRIYAILTIVLVPVAVVVAALMAPDVPQAPTRIPSPWRAIVEVLRGREAFCRLVGSYFLMQLGITVYDLLVFYFVTRALGLENLFLLLACLQFVVTIVSLPVLNKLGGYVSKHRLLSSFCILFPAAVAILASVPEENVPAAVLSYVFIGISVAPYRVMPTSMAADCAEHDRGGSGADRSGTHMAVLTLANKLALAVGVGVAFPLLDVIGFDSVGDNPDATLTNLRLLVAILPAVFIVPAVFILRKYILTLSTDASLE